MNLLSFGIAAFAAVLPLSRPSAAQTRPMTDARRIALVSDPHVSLDAPDAAYVKNFERVIDEVNSAKVDAVLITGDLTQHGGAPAFDRFAGMAKRFDAPTRWVAGNHDVGNKPMSDAKGTATGERVALYEKALGPAWFADNVLPGVRVIGVASSLFDTGLPAEAAEWSLLEKELAPSEAPKTTILLTHYPPFVAAADERDDYFNVNAPARRRLIGLIEKSNITAVLAGHLHRPVDNLIGNVPVIGAPAVSFGLPRGKQSIGWKLVTIAGDGHVTAENHYLAEATPATLPADGSLLVPASQPALSDRVQIFYYDWYGAPPLQATFVHWQQGGHTPPDDIGSNYYPKLGPYSSADKAVLAQHMAWIKQAGIGTICLTWWGRTSFEEHMTGRVLDAAADAGLKVNFHLEPYAGLTPARLADDVRYLLATYRKHPAFYRANSLGNKPMFYVFESTRHAAVDWKAALDELRANVSEPVVILAQTSDLELVEAGGFDGGYTYDGLAPFKNPGFLVGWTTIAERFAAAGKLFVPSVGPGYWDDRAVPVKGADEPEAARTRDGGRATTYDAAWVAAIAARTPFVTVTSFNEWHEGSQIEPAVGRRIEGYNYSSYAEGDEQYLNRTAFWAAKFVADRPSRR